MGFTSTTTSTALVGYLFTSFGRVLDYKSRDHGSIPTKGELFISTFPLFPVTYVFIVFEILVFNIQYLYCYQVDLDFY